MAQALVDAGDRMVELGVAWVQGECLFRVGKRLRQPIAGRERTRAAVPGAGLPLVNGQCRVVGSFGLLETANRPEGIAASGQDRGIGGMPLCKPRGRVVGALELPCSQQGEHESRAGPDRYGSVFGVDRPAIRILGISVAAIGEEQIPELDLHIGRGAALRAYACRQ